MTTSDPTNFQVIPLGVGDAFSTNFRRANSGFVILAGEHRLLLDCPAYIGALLRQASETSGIYLSAPLISHTIITHLHDDHAGGLLEYAINHAIARNPQTAPSRDYSAAEQAAAQRVGRPTLVSHPAVMAAVWPQRLYVGLGQSLNDAGEYVQNRFSDFYKTGIIIPGQRKAIGDSGIEVEARLNTHHIPCAAYRVYYNGRCIGFSGDTSFDPALVDWLAEANLLFHESTYGPGHTPYAALRDYVATRPGLADKLYLYHYPDNFDVVHSALKVATVGRVYSV
jgi:ribonuclease BN (tRNA processing enzyme)